MRRRAGERTLAVLVLLAASTVATGDQAPVAQPDLVVLWSDPQHAVPKAARRDLVRETEELKPLEFPAVWILVPNVREILERKGWRSSPPVLARALSRVAAHEIVHALGLGHARRGLMRPGLGASDLTGPWVQVDDAFRRALLGAVGRSHLQPIDS